MSRAELIAAAEALEVHLGDMRESNGRVTWIVTLTRSGGSVFDGYQIYADAIKGRAEYEAAALKHLLGQGPKPDLLSFDTDPPQAAAIEAPEPVAWFSPELGDLVTIRAPNPSDPAKWMPLVPDQSARIAELDEQARHDGLSIAILRARNVLLEGLLGEALDTCHLGDDAGLHKRMRAALGLK